MNPTHPRIGWIGLGDQGAPMARAIAEAGYPLHIWARRRTSLDVLAGVPYAYSTVAGLGSDSDIVGLCLNDDPDVREVVTTGGLLESLQPGAVLVNFGTGLPAFAVELAGLAPRTVRSAEKTIPTISMRGRPPRVRINRPPVVTRLVGADNS